MTGWIDADLSDSDVAAVLREQFVVLTWTVGDRDLRERLADNLTADVITEVVRPLRTRLAEVEAERDELRAVNQTLNSSCSNWERAWATVQNRLAAAEAERDKVRAAHSALLRRLRDEMNAWQPEHPGAKECATRVLRALGDEVGD